MWTPPSWCLEISRKQSTLAMSDTSEAATIYSGSGEGPITKRERLRPAVLPRTRSRP
jgi:hypothetical protein